jgi:hypothetical protein
VNTITLLETGPYLTPTISPNLDQTNTNPVAEGSIVRPDLVGNPIPAHRTSNNYFNLNAFAPTPVDAARVGNAGVGILEGNNCSQHTRGIAVALRSDVHERSQPHELCATRDQREQPEHVRSAPIRDCGKRRKPYWASSAAARLLNAINGKKGIATAFVATQISCQFLV